MKFNKILTFALVALMLFSSVSVLIPVRASAAHDSFAEDTKNTADVVGAIVDNYVLPDVKNNPELSFTSNEDMFNYDMSKGYLVSSTNGQYSIYVNRYTGVLYYRNNLTGELLTSNPYSVKGDYSLASQIEIKYSYSNGQKKDEIFLSANEAAKRGQISVERIDGGIRVNYTLGETATRYLAPITIEAERFEERILTPMMNAIYEQMVLCFGEENCIPYFESEYYTGTDINASQFLHRLTVPNYLDQYVSKKLIAAAKKGVYGEYTGELKSNCEKLDEMRLYVNSIMAGYTTRNPNAMTATGYPAVSDTQIEDWATKVDTPTPIVKKGYAVYVMTDTKNSNLSQKAEYFKMLVPEYTFDMMFEDEAFCEYVHNAEDKPVFRCSLEYTFNSDGSLSVRLPSNSISFDETKYILHSITPIKYFGAGDFTNDGYFFIPDGSGSIIEFEDFRNSNVTLTSSLEFYGKDYCYSEISGAHQQHLTMPVYGIKSQVKNADGDLVDTGYFAILEEGSSMAKINLSYNQNIRNAGSIYTTMTPYPQDKFSYDESANSTITLVSKSKYTGSYVTRYVMLSETSFYDGRSYTPGYVGMAEYYRNYLENTGVLKMLDDVAEDIPLYIEALGSIDVMEKFLTFPVTVSRAITTFDDIATMYEELLDAKNKILEKAQEYQSLADEEEDDETLKNRYQERADEYKELATRVENITNVNFKLTGFSNGGMSFTYPAKVKWESSLGGKRGFKDLLETAKSYNDQGYNFGVYPEFDFQYINNTELFDGVGKRNTVSRLVDNRYASKQKYSSITREFDTIYAMIVSADALDRLYSKFEKKYSKYDVTGISVSTLGSDLNSNLDKDNPVSRDESLGYVSSLLDRIANESNYDVMISKGNIYAVEFADHILDIATDSTYYRYSSYTVPFVGMILHGRVSYSGSALNYSGSPDYDILRSIESGAAPYYVLGFRNTDLMKDDEELNSYYSVDYNSWFEDIVESYTLINKLLSEIQTYTITDHRVLIGEQSISESEKNRNLNRLKAEFIEKLDLAIRAELDAKHAEIQKDIENGTVNYGEIKVGIVADIDAVVEIAKKQLKLDDEEAVAALDEEFRNSVKAVYDFHHNDGHKVIYSTSDAEANTRYVTIDKVEYTSEYRYMTDSCATDGKNYVYTDYTVDSDLIVMVTYEDGNGNKRIFLLNYNIYAVEVTLENGETYTLDKYDYEIL